MKFLKAFVLAILFHVSGAHAFDEIEALGYHKEEITCLARVIYHETRGEPHSGKLGVARVAFNRVKNPEFPDSICKVIRQPNAFPWYHKLKTPYASVEFVKARYLAIEIYVKEQLGIKWAPRVSENALFFNTVPFQYKRLRYSGKLGAHLFYNMEPRRT